MSTLIEQTFNNSDKLIIVTEKIGTSILIKISLQNLDTNYSNSKRTVGVRFKEKESGEKIEYQNVGYISEKVSTYGPLTFTPADFPVATDFKNETYSIEVIVSNIGQPGTKAIDTEFTRFTYIFQNDYKYDNNKTNQIPVTEETVPTTITTENYEAVGKKLYPPSLNGIIPAGHDLSNVAVPFIMNKTVGWSEIDGIQLLVKNVNNNQQIATTRAYKIDKDNCIAYFNLNQFLSSFLRGQNYKFQIAYVGKIGEII